MSSSLSSSPRSYKYDIAYLTALPLTGHDRIPYLQIELEREILDQCLTRANKQVNVIISNASIENILKVLIVGTRLLYISGHGMRNGRLVLEDDQLTGDARIASTAELQEVICGGVGMRQPPQLVVLPICYSDGLKQAFFMAGVQFVIGIHRRRKLLDDDALSFMNMFIYSLLAGNDVKDAFDASVVSTKTKELFILSSSDEADPSLTQLFPQLVEGIYHKSTEERPHNLPFVSAKHLSEIQDLRGNILQRLRDDTNRIVTIVCNSQRRYLMTALAVGSAHYLVSRTRYGVPFYDAVFFMDVRQVTTTIQDLCNCIMSQMSQKFPTKARVADIGTNKYCFVVDGVKSMRDTQLLSQFLEELLHTASRSTAIVASARALCPSTITEAIIHIYDPATEEERREKFLADNIRDPSCLDGDNNINSAVNNPQTLLLPTSKSHELCWGIPEQRNVYVERDRLSNTLTHQLMPGVAQTSSTVVLVACKGMGGVGKTQLALRYIRHPPHDYAVRVWFAAESRLVLTNGYQKFGEAVGIQSHTPTAMVIAVRKWLSSLQRDSLLVYDNVTQYEDIEEFLPSTALSSPSPLQPSQHRIMQHIVMTSRYVEWPQSIRAINIGVMTEAESVAFVKVLSELNEFELNESSIKQLVFRLGYLPLAMSQAAAYIRIRQCSVKQYLSLYERNEYRLLNDETMSATLQHVSVGATWQMSLDAIESDEASITTHTGVGDSNGLARGMLTACAYLAPEPIPHFLLIRWILQRKAVPGIDEADVEFAFYETKRLLLRYSVLQQVDKQSVIMHRLVQAVIRYKQEGEFPTHQQQEPFILFLMESITKEISMKEARSAKDNLCIQLLPHMVALIDHHDRQHVSMTDHRMLSAAAAILETVGNTYVELGAFEKGKNILERVLSLTERLFDADHLRVMSVLSSLGIANRRAGDYTTGKTLLERALAIAEKHFGPDDLEVGLALGNLGAVYRLLDENEKAKESLDRSVKIKEAYYGPDRDLMSSVLCYLGAVYLSLGDYGKAKELLERSKRIEEKHFGENHYRVAFTLVHLGNLSSQTGDLKTAIKLIERALTIAEQYYGPDHSEVANALASLGARYLQSGDYKQAKTILERALKIEEEQHGPFHSQVAVVLVTLALTWKKLGDAMKAKELLERALNIRERCFPPCARLIMEIITILKQIFGLIGDFDGEAKMATRIVSFSNPPNTERLQQ